MAGLVGLALTSCDDKSDLGVMQKNEAPIVVPTDGVAIKSIYASEGNSINLQDYEESVNIPLIDIALSTDFPASSIITGQVEIADNADFTNAKTLSLTSTEVSSGNADLAAAVNGNTRSLQGYVEVNAWEDAFVSFYGLNPTANVNYVRYKLWLNNDSQNVILYNNDGEEWFDAMEFMVTPFDAKLDVASAYNLTYTVNGVPTTVEMYHNPANHVYDDPMFNAMVEVPEEGEGAAEFTWTISPDNDASTVFGVEGDDPAVQEGNLISGGVAGQILVPGTYKIEANMLDKTFTVKIAPASLFVIFTSGQFNQVSQLSTSDYVTYEGVAGLTNKWALTGQANYRPTLYVNNPEVETEKEGTFTTKGGIKYSNGGSTAANSEGLPYSGAGLYYIKANLQELTYESYFCKTMGITGSMEALKWGEAGADIALTSKRSDLYLIWTGTLTVNAGNEWKIRANSDWTINFGAAGDGSYVADGTTHYELAKDGANFVAPEAGTYTVTVYFNGMTTDGGLVPYYMTIAPAN